MKYIPIMIAIGLATGSFIFAAPAAAQTAPISEPIQISTDSTATPKKRRIIKKVEPIPYWVDADQLRIRDNPVAGDVNGMLKLGQKIKAYEVFENWLRISKAGAPEQWVNSDYLTARQVTWARYDNTKRRSAGFSRVNTADDVSLKRIKVPENNDVKIYAASIKKTANDNRVIVTRQNFRSGPHFEKRLVSCGADKQAQRVQLLGEGYNYMMMEKDIRGQDVDVNSASPRRVLAGNDFSATTVAIANFSCK
ncbi:MAG: hypothetical protein ABJN69_01270 [Hellea sp.]